MSSYVLSPMYHGTAEHIAAFDPDRTGQGEDQYGSGFYFDSSKNHAETYANIAYKEHRGDNPNIISAKLTFERPIIIPADELTLECIEVTDAQAVAILTLIPGFYIKDMGENPIGDYLSYVWSHPPKTKADFIRCITQLVAENYSDTNLRQLDFLCAKWSTEFRTAVRTVLGYDGVIINYPHSQQAVAWFPEQIDILSSTPC